MLLRSRALTLALALLASCQFGDEPGFDLDDPSLPELDDTPPCAGYPGGELSGDDLLVLVNKEEGQQLRSDWQPADLISLPGDSLMRGLGAASLRYDAAKAFLDMILAARSEEGLILVARSAYRSFKTQCYTFDAKVRANGIEHARRFSAEPGRSQHQLGTTVDITSASLGYGLLQSMGSAPEGQWLAENAHRFGFALSYPQGSEDITGYAYEPWHYRYIGAPAALELRESGEILEIYLQRCQDGDPTLECPRHSGTELGPGEGFIGGACEMPEDCTLGSEGYCAGEFDGFPGGMCTQACTASCPDRPGPNPTSGCMATENGGLCVARCDYELFPETGCRDTYQCLSVDRPQGDTMQACVPSSW